MTSPDPQYLTFIERVREKLGIDLSSYKPRQMQRRLAILMQQLGEKDFNSMSARLERDEQARNQFLNFFTINVSEFFRDPEIFDELRTRIIPLILNRNPSRVWTFRVWSAACSIGLEPYSLAIMLENTFPETVYQILATDIDQTALLRARNGGPYSANDVRHIPAETLTQAMSGDSSSGYFMRDRYKMFVRFRQHDLTKDAFMLKHDLILCRNVLIYFTTEAKEILYQKLADSLKTGGIIFTGATEFIPQPERFNLANVGGPFYQKTAVTFIHRSTRPLK